MSNNKNIWSGVLVVKELRGNQAKDEKGRFTSSGGGNVHPTDAKAAATAGIREGKTQGDKVLQDKKDKANSLSDKAHKSGSREDHIAAAKAHEDAAWEARGQMMRTRQEETGGKHELPWSDKANSLHSEDSAHYAAHHAHMKAADTLGMSDVSNKATAAAERAKTLSKAASSAGTKESHLAAKDAHEDAWLKHSAAKDMATSIGDKEAAKLHRNAMSSSAAHAVKHSKKADGDNRSLTVPEVSRAYNKVTSAGEAGYNASKLAKEHGVKEHEIHGAFMRHYDVGDLKHENGKISGVI
jgi:hypothetical protein